MYMVKTRMHDDWYNSLPEASSNQKKKILCILGYDKIFSYREKCQPCFTLKIYQKL